MVNFFNVYNLFWKVECWKPQSESFASFHLLTFIDSNKSIYARTNRVVEPIAAEDIEFASQKMIDLRKFVIRFVRFDISLECQYQHNQPKTSGNTVTRYDNKWWESI